MAQNAFLCKKSVPKHSCRFFVFGDLWHTCFRNETDQQYARAKAGRKERNKMKILAQKETKRTKMKTPSWSSFAFVTNVNASIPNYHEAESACFQTGARRFTFPIPKSLISMKVSDISRFFAVFGGIDFIKSLFWSSAWSEAPRPRAAAARRPHEEEAHRERVTYEVHPQTWTSSRSHRRGWPFEEDFYSTENSEEPISNADLVPDGSLNAHPPIQSPLRSGQLPGPLQFLPGAQYRWQNPGDGERPYRSRRGGRRTVDGHSLIRLNPAPVEEPWRIGIDTSGKFFQNAEKLTGLL